VSSPEKKKKVGYALSVPGGSRDENLKKKKKQGQLSLFVPSMNKRKPDSLGGSRKKRGILECWLRRVSPEPKKKKGGKTAEGEVPDCVREKF